MYSTVVANCVFNAFLCYTAIALNIITIQALRNTSSLPSTLKTILPSLAVSDLGVGLLVHPLYIARLVMNTEQSSNISAYHGVYTVHLIIGYVFSNASFLGVVLLTVDRFLAIHLHLRYRQLVTHKRVIVAVVLKWLLSSISSLFCVRAVTATRGESALGLHLLYYAATIMYLNSSLNPLIYCWKMRHIRQVVVQILRSVFACQ